MVIDGCHYGVEVAGNHIVWGLGFKRKHSIHCSTVVAQGSAYGTGCCVPRTLVGVAILVI